MVYPTFQQEALNLTCDYDVFKHVLELTNRFADVDMFLTSGYVNFPPEVVELLTSFKGEMKFLFAAPQANSFFHDPGFASVIPALYNIVRQEGNDHMQLQCNFFHRCKEKSANTCLLESDKEFICSLEYLNKDWTYHSKGLWLFRKNSPESLVTIGSPNFGMRSYFRDMESQLYMISESPNYILNGPLYSVPSLHLENYLRMKLIIGSMIKMYANRSD